MKNIFCLISVILVVGCSSSGKSGSQSSGRYYQDDGPPSYVRHLSTSDAIPQIERLSARGNSPYTVKGQRYTPNMSVTQLVEQGDASWYGKKFHGRITSSGETYDMFAMTAAHKTLPLPSYVRVTNLQNNLAVVVKVNDRGPFLKGRIIDLSFAAAAKIGLDKAGVAPVQIELILAPQANL